MISTTTTTMRWPDRWRALFGHYPTDQERETIEAWLDEALPGWHADELHAAMELYAERARREGGRIRPPECPVIKTNIIRLRYERRVQAEGGAGSAERVRISRMLPPDMWRDGQSRWTHAEPTIGQLRTDMMHARPAERFEIACSPNKTDDCAKLMALAEAMPGGVEWPDGRNAPAHRPPVGGTVTPDVGQDIEDRT